MKSYQNVSFIFPSAAVDCATRCAMVKNNSAIGEISSEFVEISSDLVEISSEFVEISSDLVEISSELVSRISELLIISTFRKALK